MSKEPTVDPAERSAIFRLATGYLCRHIAQRTTVLTVAEVAVPIPANADRFVARMASLPDELARSVEAQLAVPAANFALEWVDAGVEMKSLSWAERRVAIAQALRPGREIDLVAGRGWCCGDAWEGELVASGVGVGGVEWGRQGFRADGVDCPDRCAPSDRGRKAHASEPVL
jgi:hypothetical protein